MLRERNICQRPSRIDEWQVLLGEGDWRPVGTTWRSAENRLAALSGWAVDACERGLSDGGFLEGSMRRDSVMLWAAAFAAGRPSPAA